LRGRPAAITAEKEEILKDLHSKGYPDGEIAERMGVSRTTVVRARYKLGLKANRGRGERGPGKPKPDESYFFYTQKLIQYVADVLNKATKHLQENKEIDADTAFVSRGMFPGNLTHPDLAPYVAQADRINLTAAEKIVFFEQKMERAGLAGVPGIEIIELARIYKTGDPEECFRLACECIKKAGLINASATVQHVEYGILAPVPAAEYRKKWEEELQGALQWAPVQERSKIRVPKTFAKRRSRTGKKGKCGGTINIHDRQAYASAAGY